MIQETGFSGLYVITPRLFADERGYFCETYNAQTLAESGICYNFVQDNQAQSQRGVLRGLHYQKPPFSQAKLVRVVEGEVYDVVVDVRIGSPTFGKWFGIVLSADNHKQLMVPHGFAHGYLVLSPTALFAYKCDNFYAKSHEGGIAYNDPELAIDWQIPANELIVSEKDSILPRLADIESPFSVIRAHQI